jgi:transcriptional regulator with XRE-family HTH domain
MDIRREVGENIRLIREAAGLSQEELAVRMGVDQGYVSSLEAGRRNPTILTIWHAAMALRTQPANLFEPPKSAPPKRKRTPRVASGSRAKTRY